MESDQTQGESDRIQKERKGGKGRDGSANILMGCLIPFDMGEPWANCICSYRAIKFLP